MKFRDNKKNKGNKDFMIGVNFELKRFFVKSEEIRRGYLIFVGDVKVFLFYFNCEE